MDEKTALQQMKFLEAHSKHMRLAAESWKNDFEILISTILSARSLDETTIKYATILFEKYPNPKSLSKAKISEVEKIIKPINFYKNKSKSIIKCAKQIHEEFNNQVPHDYEKLISLSGVGTKTANVFLSEKGKKGLGVDTHVFYIARYLNWTKSNKPEKVEQDLKKLFSKKNWNKINPALVRFGKTHTSKREKDALLNEAKKIV